MFVANRLKRILVRSGAVLALILFVTFALSRLGAFLVVSDPLQPAEAIVVLGGTMYERPLEAVDLYKAGLAPRIYLFREIADYGERELIARNVPFLRAVDVQVDLLQKIGVPRDAITILDEAASTADEAANIHDLVTR